MAAYSSRAKVRLQRFLAGAALLAVVSMPARALQDVVLTAGPLQGPGWSVAGLEVRIRIDADGALSADLEASDVRLPGWPASLERISARCRPLRFGAGGIGCRDGELRLKLPEGGPEIPPVPFDADYSAGGFRFETRKLRLGAGTLGINLDLSGAGGHLRVNAARLPLADVSGLLGPVLGIQAQSGTVSGRFRWRVSPKRGEASADISIESLRFSDKSGLNAGEMITLELGIEAIRDDGPWKLRLKASMPGGQLYLHPVFIDAADGVLDFDARGRASRAPARLELQSLALSHAGVGRVEGSAALVLVDGAVALDRIGLETRELAFSRFYRLYLEPWLLETVFAHVELSGDVSARLDWSRPGPSSAELVIEGLDVDDGGGRFAVSGLGGRVHWRDAGSPAPTRLGFQSARIYRVDLGAAEIHGSLAGDRFELEKPLTLPLLGGALSIAGLEARGLGGETFSLSFGAALESVSLQALSRSFGWPAFSGNLSGRLPALRYAGTKLSVDGTLTMNAFDGRMDIDDLTLTDPFGVVPRARADIRVTDLALGDLTRTFSFGNIQGRLSGRIDDLVLENWRPAAFDAEFATPEDDPSRHRISQRAIENLARLGGAGQVLSSTVLRFLDAFSYDRLGLSCRLENGICHMGGVRDAGNGYYIVEGGYLPPRIDVFGYNRRVDWDTLVERLKAVTRAEDAVIR